MFHVSHVSVSLLNPQLRRAYSINRQAKTFGKILYPGKKRRRFDNTLPSITKISDPIGQPGKSGKKRVEVLNKLFMKNVTDLLANGSTLANEILGKGMEISEVKVTASFNIVNVYWLTKSEKADAEIEDKLKSIAGRLRHELSQLKIMGVVPIINFVKDEQLARSRKLDKLLAIADYGEDYVPSQLGQVLRTEFTSAAQIPGSVKETIRELEKTEDVEEDPLPQMTNYVYGLDHDKIMGKIMASLNISQTAWIRDIDKEESLPETSLRRNASETSNIVPSEMDHKSLVNFLKKRKVDQQESYKEMFDRDYEKEVAEQPSNRDENENFEYLDLWIEKFDSGEDNWESEINSE